jgi:hypothetical protein
MTAELLIESVHDVRPLTRMSKEEKRWETWACEFTGPRVDSLFFFRSDRAYCRDLGPL